MANESKRSPEKDEIILDALRDRPKYAYAARKAGISRGTLQRWRAEDPEFDKRVKAARKQGFEVVEDHLVDRALRDDTTALIFLLKNNMREVYGDRSDINVSGSLSNTVTVVFAERSDGPQ